MFLFPLGLKARTRRFPIVTLLILFSTVVYSILRFDSHHGDLKERFKSDETKSLFESRSKLLLSVCDKTEFELNDCRFIQSRLKSNSSENPLVAKKELISALEREYDEKVRASKLELFQKYIFEDDYWLTNDLSLDSAEYLNYRSAYERYFEDRKNSQKEQNILSQGNFNWKSLIEAQVTHGGWLHLIMNMAIFVLMSIPVEERIGPLATAFIYAVGGSFGLAIQVPFLTDPTIQLLGASANVSAIAGLFLILFRKQQMKIWVSYLFIVNKTVEVPTWIFVPLFLVLNDLIGLIEMNSNVAHLAHLSGLMFGVLSGMALIQLKPLPSNSVFPFERQELQRALSSSNSIERVKIAHSVLYHNPNNTEAQSLLLETILENSKSSISNSSFTSIPRPFQKALEINFHVIFTRYLEHERKDIFLKFMGSIPVDWPIEKWIGEVDLHQLNEAISNSELNDKHEVATKLLEVLITCHPNEIARQEARARIEMLVKKKGENARSAI